MNATEDPHIELRFPDTYLVGRCWDNSRGWNESWLRLDDCLGDNGGTCLILTASSSLTLLS